MINVHVDSNVNLSVTYNDITDLPVGKGYNGAPIGQPPKEIIDHFIGDDDPLPVGTILALKKAGERAEGPLEVVLPLQAGYVRRHEYAGWEYL